MHSRCCHGTSNLGQAALLNLPAPPRGRASTTIHLEACREVGQMMKMLCSLFIVVAWGGLLPKLVSSEQQQGASDRKMR